VVRLQCVWRLRVVAAVTHTRTIATATTQMEQVPIHALDSGCYKLRCPRRVRGLGVVTGLVWTAVRANNGRRRSPATSASTKS
jgi:hypothetical protein